MMGLGESMAGMTSEWSSEGGASHVGIWGRERASSKEGTAGAKALRWEQA